MTESGTKGYVCYGNACRVRVCVGQKVVTIGGIPRFSQEIRTDFGPATMVDVVEPDSDPEVTLEDDPEVTLE